MRYFEQINNTNSCNDFIEPVFYFGINKNRKLPFNINPIHTYNSFEYRLKENPGDLLCHLQRIQFSIVDKNKAELFSSICDLFIVLGAHGKPLHQRLFGSCKKALTLYLTTAFFKKETFKIIEPDKQSEPVSNNSEDILQVTATSLY